MRTRGGLLQVVGRTVVVGVAVLSVMAAIGPSPVSAGTVTAAAPLGGPAAVATLPVSGGGSVTPQVVAGGNHTCALLSDGTVRCWGRGADGRLGDGFTDNRLNPVQVLASGTAETDPVVLGGVTQIATGNAHTCALLSDGTVRCWGSNSAGQLGDGSTTSRSNPVQVLASGTAGTDPVVLGGVTQIATGNAHTCALLSGGTVRCWGRGGDGRLGDGTTTDRSNPVQVLASGTAGTDPVVLGGVTQIAAGNAHTCALLSNRTVRCWGGGSRGQLGDGTTTARLHPVQVLASGTAGTDPVVLGGVTQIATGDSHTCALLSDRTVRCWGGGDDGQLGDGFTDDRSNPVQVLASGTAGTDPVVLGGVTQIAAGNRHTCALLSDGTVRCWGRGNDGRLGDGTTAARLNPVQVLASGTAGTDPVVLGGVIQVSAGDFHTCALLSNGTVRCWGNGGQGRLGDGTTSRAENPVVVLSSGTSLVDPVVFSVLVAVPVVSGQVPGIAVNCDVAAPQVAATVTCTVSGGDPGIDILWRAAYNPVFAGEGVTLDASGSGEFSFTVPAAALGQELTVELVEWAAPVSLGVVGGPVPSSVPSGGGPVPVWTLALLALFGFGLLRRGMRAQA
jgi:alpha-tubulin suppressor-like RCC1 family protein